MIYREEYKNIFDLSSDEYYFAQCISSDCAMGKGIAVEFNRQFNLKEPLLKMSNEVRKYPTCILVNGVFNLITKEFCYNKPTYITIRRALLQMKKLIIENNIKKIAMPVIGCGLDRLNWEFVTEIIYQIFNDLDIEILICKKL